MWNKAVCCSASLSIEVRKNGQIIFQDDFYVQNSSEGIKYDRTFVIQSGPLGDLTISSPNGGETLYKGQECTVIWEIITPIVSNVTLSLYKGNVEVLNIAGDLDPSDLSYIFTLPESLAEGGDYRIHISVESGTVVDFSDYYFTIVDATDSDSDGLPDSLENAGCTAFDNPDSDADGILDGVEDANHNGVVDTGETNP